MSHPVARSTRTVAKRWSAELELVGAGGEPVDLWRTITSHGVADLPPNLIDEEARTLETTLMLTRGRARTIRVGAGRPGFALVEGEAVGPRDALALADAARHMLRLEADLSPFYDAALDDPGLAWACTGAGRMLRSPTVFEDVVKTSCTLITTLLSAAMPSPADHRSVSPAPEAKKLPQRRRLSAPATRASSLPGQTTRTFPLRTVVTCGVMMTGVLGCRTPVASWTLP